MDFFDKLGSGRIGGSIETQWRTNLAIERMMIGLERGAGGFTKFLSTIETIGFILMILFSLIFICILCFCRLVLFFVKIYKFLFMKQENIYHSGISDSEYAEMLKNELSDDDIEELNKLS